MDQKISEMLKNQWIAWPTVILFMVLAGYVSIGGISIIDAIEQVNEVEEKFEEQIYVPVIRKGIQLDDIYHQLELKAMRINATAAEDKEINLTVNDKQIIENLKNVYWYYDYPGYSYVLFLTIMPIMPLMFLVAGSNGICGSIIKLLFDSGFAKIPIKNTHYLAIILLGFGMGIAVFGLLYLISPSILGIGIVGKLFMGLFAGWFSKRFTEWILTRIPVFS